MVNSSQLNPGMIVSIDDALYKVVSITKVSVAKGDPFLKAILKEISSEQVIEKNFKLGQDLKEVAFESHSIEFLYQENGDYLFLDVGNYEKVLVEASVIGDKVLFLKAGIRLTAMVYGNKVFSVELPYFLELMVSKMDLSGEEIALAGGTKRALLETGATIQVPPFIEVGDVIKIDTRICEYIQRV
ncbi:elongation factor P [Candidatus Clavichlamydia salmonicola]|uniref:elongation factor P n=1 Tax=Candidatus Clavichlamydia salmonicola TaxID=469812 RepID=UPI001890FAE3|nr:elongation factor P [Candidatus Clavichlamydia salmonicola]